MKTVISLLLGSLILSVPVATQAAGRSGRPAVLLAQSAPAQALTSEPGPVPAEQAPTEGGQVQIVLPANSCGLPPELSPPEEAADMAPPPPDADKSPPMARPQTGPVLVPPAASGEQAPLPGQPEAAQDAEKHAAAPTPDAGQDAAVPPADAGHGLVQLSLKLMPEVEKTCAEGKVKIKLIASYPGHLTGDKIPVTLIVQAPADFAFDFQSLQLDSNDSRFELASPPVLRYGRNDDSMSYRADFWVQSFADLPVLNLQVLLRYAQTYAPDKSPLWQELAAPAFIMSHARTILPGINGAVVTTEVSEAQARHSWAIVPCFVLGLTLVLGVVFLQILRSVNRVRPRRVTPPALAAWLELDKLVRSGNEIGFTSKHYEKISAAFKTYLRWQYPQLEQISEESVREGLAGDSKRTAIASALGKLRAVVYAGNELTPAEHKQLLVELRTVVTRPWSI